MAHRSPLQPPNPQHNPQPIKQPAAITNRPGHRSQRYQPAPAPTTKRPKSKPASQPCRPVLAVVSAHAAADPTISAVTDKAVPAGDPTRPPTPKTALESFGPADPRPPSGNATKSPAGRRAEHRHSRPPQPQPQQAEPNLSSTQAADLDTHKPIDAYPADPVNPSSRVDGSHDATSGPLGGLFERLGVAANSDTFRRCRSKPESPGPLCRLTRRGTRGRRRRPVGHGAWCRPVPCGQVDQPGGTPRLALVAGTVAAPRPGRQALQGSHTLQRHQQCRSPSPHSPSRSGRGSLSEPSRSRSERP